MNPEEKRESAVELRRVRKRFGYRDVLQGADLDIPSGARFVLFGPNGAGKSTLLKIVATQWTSSEGEVRVLGKDARRDPVGVRAIVGLVSHDSFLRKELTLEENLLFACDLHGMPRVAANPRIDVLIDRLGLANRREDRVGTFSQGMTKRASIARSLLNQPELWILDEPFSGLDAEGQVILEGMIREFAGTVLLVTHEASLGLRLASHSALIQEGRIVRTGSGGAAWEAPGDERGERP